MSSVISRQLLVIVLIASVTLIATWLIRRSTSDAPLVSTVERQTLNVQLTTSGFLTPAQSVSYRSPIVGKEAEIIAMAPEGARVKADDLLVQLDTTELEQDVERLRQELRQTKLDLQLAHAERQDAEVAVRMASEGEGALTVEEARTRLQLAQNRAKRLRQEYQQLTPLLDRGFITRDELARTGDDLEQADEELTLAQKRADVIVRLTHPREKQRAALQLAQKNSQLEDVVGRIQEIEQRLLQTEERVTGSRIHAKRPGLVVYEQFLNASPSRKVRVGDRVTASQGLVTLPDLDRMLVQSSVSEADVHRVRYGQRAVVRLEAFPDLRLTGKVARVGTMASMPINSSLDDKRFELTIELDPSDTDLRPEMTARVDIQLGTRDNVLVVPVTSVFESQGVFVVYAVNRWGTESRTVTLGETDGVFVEVREGLELKEQVALAKPDVASGSASLGGASVQPSAPIHEGR